MKALSRRSMLASAAAVPAAVAAPAIPAFCATDPIFAAIERHRRAEAAQDAALDACTAADRDGSGRLTPEIEGLEYTAGEFGDSQIDRLCALAAMTPTTVAGCAAMLKHVERWLIKNDRVPIFAEWHDDLEESGKTLLGRIAATLEKSA